MNDFQEPERHPVQLMSRLEDVILLNETVSEDYRKIVEHWFGGNWA